MPVSAPSPSAPLELARRPRGRTSAAAVTVALLAVAGFAVQALPDDASSVDRVSTALDRSSLVPRIDPVDATALHPQRLAPAPGAGEILRLPGPFDDAVRLDGLTMDPSAGVLAGRATVLDEGSELIVLELQAAWYDVAGVLLDTSRTAMDQEDAQALGAAHVAGETGDDHERGMPFALSAPVDVRDRVVSAQLHVLALVNE